MRKYGKYVILTIYIIIAFISTTFLFFMNDYNVCEFNDKVLISYYKTDEYYKKGSLIFIDKTDEVNKDDVVFYYNKVKDNTVKAGKVDDVIKLGSTTYRINNNNISSDRITGKASKVIPFLGYIYGVLTSRLGYLFIVILPIVFLFIYEIVQIIFEVKAVKRKK